MKKKKFYLIIFVILVGIYSNSFSGEVNPMIPDNTVVIQFFSQNQNIIGAVVFKRDAIKYYKIPDAEKKSAELIDKWVSSFGGKDITDVSAALFNILIKPIESEIANHERIVFIPSGNLFKIPMSALYDPVKKAYLIETYKISYINNLEMMAKPSLFTNRDINTYLFGNGLYNIRNKESFSRGVTVKENDVVIYSYSNYNLDWPNLPGTKIEIDRIQGIIKKFKQYKDCHVYEGINASESSLKKLVESIKPGTNNIIHLAAHGFYDEVRPSNSAVVLSLDGDEGNDGYFSINEIINLDLKNIVFVLSACETAKGKIIPGEGIFNLPKFMLLSNSNNVIGTLFPIADEPTAEFMEAFYQSLSVEKDIVSALRYAQLSFINQKSKKSDPYYWASFVVYGK